jgi:hypothetical protein
MIQLTLRLEETLHTPAAFSASAVVCMHVCMCMLSELVSLPPILLSALCSELDSYRWE